MIEPAERDPITQEVPEPHSAHHPGPSPDVPLHVRDHSPVEPVTSDAPEVQVHPRPAPSPDVPLHHRGS